MRKLAPRRLERFRAKKSTVKVPHISGLGKKVAREAKAVNMKAELQLKKKDGKAIQELISLDVVALQEKLLETRKELFEMRFSNVSGQLTNVAGISAARRRIARILTLIGQKEVGA